VRDLGSKNGIRVNGARCQVQRLPPGSVLWVGGLRFEVAYPSAGAARPEGPQPPFAQSLLEKAGLARGRSVLPPEPEDDSPRRYSLDDPE
jgi:hypothetical protein